MKGGGKHENTVLKNRGEKIKKEKMALMNALQTNAAAAQEAKRQQGEA